MKKVRKAIIPAAGLGTRFLPATKAMPKEILPIVDKPTIQYIVEEAIDSGIEDIIIVTGKGKRAIEDHFDHAPELERNLEEKGKKELLEKVQKASNMADIHYINKKNQKDSDMPYGVLATSSAMSLSPFCSETTSFRPKRRGFASSWMNMRKPFLPSSVFSRYLKTKHTDTESSILSQKKDAGTK